MEGGDEHAVVRARSHRRRLRFSNPGTGGPGPAPSDRGAARMAAGMGPPAYRTACNGIQSGQVHASALVDAPAQGPAAGARGLDAQAVRFGTRGANRLVRFRHARTVCADRTTDAAAEGR